ncbi:MAG: hypothetical protein RLZ14_1070 [Actinomycetota bacterium]|jgi:hypothetical protein
MSEAAKQHDTATLARRRMLSRTWAAVVVAWSLIRTLIVWAAVGDYGLNPWIYLAIDLASASVDAVTTPRMVLSFIDNHYRAALKWATISLVVFIIPDLYIFLGTRELPRRVIVVVLLIIVATLVVGVVGVVRKVQAGRAARAAESVSD